MKCPICKQEIEEGLTSCPVCGTPIKERDGNYIKSSFVNTVKIKKTTKDLNDEYIKKSRTISGICSIVSFPLMLCAIGFLLLAFIKFQDGTFGITLSPYSICFLAPSLFLAVVAFFKSKDTNFKSVYRLSMIEIIIDAILTLLGLLLLVLYSTNII